MSTLNTATSWNNGSTSGEIKVDGTDHGNPNRNQTYMDRYALDDVSSGTTVQVYMDAGGLSDPYLQVVRTDGSVVAQNDDGGDNLDAYLSWTYQTGDVIRATTFSANTSGTYTLYTDVGTVRTANDSLPTASNVSKTVNEDENAILSRSDFNNIFNNQGDGDGLYEIRITSLPANGSLTLNDAAVTVNQVISASAVQSSISNNNFKFSGEANASGEDYASFSFQVSDGLNWSANSYTFSLNVTAVNDSPTLTGLPASATVVEDLAGQIDLSAVTLADIDAGNAVISVTIAADNGTLAAEGNTEVTVQNSGTASITLLGSVADLNAYLAAPDALQYTGEANANGNNAATLTITANDGGNTGTGGGTTALGTLAINITPANDAPTATNTSLITDEDVAHTFAIADFGIADIDTGDTLQQVRLDSLPEHGKLTLQGAMLAANDVVAAADIPSLRYEPDTHYNGTDQFSFSVFDGNAWSAGSADVALTVTSVNDAPLLTTPTTFSVEENQSVITTLGASDIEGDTLTYALVGGADRSLFSLDTSTGELSFNEAPNFEAPFNNNTDSTYEVEVQASDGQDVSSTQTIEVTVTDVNEAPVMTGQTSLHVDENTSGVVYTATADDPEGNALTYTLSGTDAELFQLDANNGTLTFKAPANYEAPVEANNDNTYDLLLTANDGSLNSVAQALAISIDNINEAPELTVNQGATVNTGRTITLTTAMLEAQDVDDTAAELTYTVTTLPSGGMLQLEGVGLAMNQTFTQADVEEGKVTYQAGKSAGQQSFTFTLADGGEDGAAAVVDQTFILTVRQKNPIQVTPNEPQPETPSGKPSVTETITNTGVSSGTAKLVENTGNANEVTATLPGGVSIVNQGARSAVVTQQALADLMGSINTQQPTNLNDQALIAEQWLNSRPSDLLLDIRTLVLSDTSNASTNTPILITGTADDGLGNGGHQEAFVIDTRSLASGHQIELDNIDFASIIGTTTVRGGAGNNVVIGDDADQTIILGAGDDELFGGGGNDVIGSEGGDDRLFGNSGNDELFGGAGADLLHGGSESDTASYTGNRDDYTITQRFGVVTVQASDDASNIDTLVNIETLTFADETLSLTYDESLQWLSGLYFQALGRQADVSGLQYWAQQHTNGMGHADIALAVLGSAETGLNLQEDAALGLLYTGLLGREADTAGQSYWNEQLAAGATIKDIAGDFMMSAEMRQHDMDVQQWDFLV